MDLNYIFFAIKRKRKGKKTRKRKLGLREGESGMKNKSAFTLVRKQNFAFTELKNYFLKRGSTCHDISSTTSRDFPSNLLTLDAQLFEAFI